MSEIARILQRELPPDEVIYKGFPAMFCPEDTVFPIDPEPKQETTGRFNNDGDSSYTGAPRAKRQRLQGASEEHSSAEESWQRAYTTTMERPTTVMKVAMPGFISVGAHQAAISAANARTEPPPRSEKSRRTETTKRPADQKSIIGFVRSNPGTARPATAAPPPAAAAAAAAVTTTASSPGSAPETGGEGPSSWSSTSSRISCACTVSGGT